MRTAYSTEIAAAAAAHGLDPNLLEAQVLVESSGQAHAYRYEPGIWQQIVEGRLTPKTTIRDPRRVAASYGLLQVLYITACDDGFTGEPEDLFEPPIGLEWGARHLAALLAWARHEAPDEACAIRSALAAYNGGRVGNGPRQQPNRNAGYAGRVLAARGLLS